MKSLSVKVKILSIIITLSVLSLGVFAYLTFNSYKKDKLAFVYDYLANETQSKSMLLTTTVENYNLFLGSIISGIDFKTRSLPAGHLKYLSQNGKISGLYYHIPTQGKQDHVTLFESHVNGKSGIEWANLESSPIGLSLMDGKKGTFLLKKPLSEPGSFAALSFKQMELADLFKSTSDRMSFVLNLKSVTGSQAHLLGKESADQIQSKLNETKMSFGLLETSVNGENFFVSYAKFGFQDFILVNMIKEKKVLLIQDVFLKQVVLFLVLIGSISLLIGTVSARWLTWQLDQLTKAAHDMENENFDTKVEVESDDELGMLGSAFNSMGDKIKFLLDELRRYNTDLELMVQERTKELQNLTDIQKAMLNSLGQGFVIIDKEHHVQPVYSKIAEDMFEVVPDQVNPSDIMGISGDEANSFKDLYDLAFAEALDFEDMAKLNPEMRSNSKNQKIFLNYAPIKNSESGTLEYVLVIGTDKTAELESLEKFKKEWNFSQMITKIASNRFALNKVISESLNMLKTAMESVESDKDYSLREVQRLVHTIKGSVSYFYIEEITTLAHEFETYLTQYYDDKKCPDSVKLIVLEKIMAMQVAIECYIDHYDSIVQYKDAAANKSIPIKDLEQFSKVLRSKNPELADQFRASFFKTKVAPYFQMYPTIVKELGLKLNKEVKFVLEGGDVALPDGNWDELFQQFIHVVRNAVDHGMETPFEREAAGKQREGKIHFKFELMDNFLKVTLGDDGQGIDWQKIAHKDPSVQSEQDALERIKTGGVSSKDEVTDTSGRGVGVSSVFAIVEKWNGKAEFINEVNKGMSIVIEVPLSSAKEQQWRRTA